MTLGSKHQLHSLRYFGLLCKGGDDEISNVVKGRWYKEVLVALI